MANTFKIEDGVLIFKNIPDQEYIDEDECEEIPNYRGAFTTIKFPRCFETLCDGDFHYCRDSLAGVTCLDFSEAVNIDCIEGDTFTGMKSLEEVSLPVKINYIPGFSKSPKLKVVHISRLEDASQSGIDGHKSLTIYAYNVDKLEEFDDDFIDGVDTLYVPAGDVKRLRWILEDEEQELDIKPLPAGAKFPPVVGGNSHRSTSTAGTSTGGKTFSLYLESVGRSNLAVVKLLKDTLGLDLAQAKRLANSAPCYIVKDSNEFDKLNALDSKLSALGAKTVLSSSTASVKSDEADDDYYEEDDTEEETSEGGSFDIDKVFAGTQYYCVLDGQQFGPVTARQFSNMARYGVVDANTLVWANGMSQWAVAQSVAELQNLV